MDEQSAQMPQSVATAPAKKPNVLLIGGKVFLADVGLSSVLGFIIGMFLGAARFTVDEIAQNPLFPVLGLLVSLYLAYVLYRKYSQEVSALVVLMVIGASWGLLNIFIAATNMPGFNSKQHLVFFAAQMVVYLAGWYIAKTTGVRLYIPKNIWFVVLSVIGGVVLLLGVLGMLWTANA